MNIQELRYILISWYFVTHLYLKMCHIIVYSWKISCDSWRKHNKWPFRFPELQFCSTLLCHLDNLLKLLYQWLSHNYIFTNPHDSHYSFMSNNEECIYRAMYIKIRLMYMTYIICLLKVVCVVREIYKISALHTNLIKRCALHAK